MNVLFATGNRHKVSEANRVGKEYGVKFVRVSCPYPEIRDESLERIASEGVKHVYSRLKKPVIVEDSGLFLKAYDGFPSPYSAYVFEKIGNGGMLKLVRGKRNRNAAFKSVIAYYDGKKLRTFTGEVKGRIALKKSGNAGFGYDPIFIPKGHSRTFAQDPELKEKISHRSRAFKKLITWLKD
ncbi:MAG: XTP/dITP diphosphatase [Candidatus Altiarchaeota archaeon]